MAGEAVLNVGDTVECTVEQIMPYGAFVRILKSGRKGMIHISEVSYNFVKNIGDVLNVQDTITAKIIKIDEKGRIDLSIKQTQEPPAKEARPANQAGRPPRNFRQPVQNKPRVNENPRPEVRNFHEMQEAYREQNPEEADSFEKKMAAFMKTSEAKITDLNTRAAKAGRTPSRRRNNRDY